MNANQIDDAYEPLQYPAKWVTGREMIRILKYCGANIRHFAEFCQRSENFIRQSLGYESFRSIPLLYIDKIREFVTNENFELALQHVRKELERSEGYRLRMKTALIHCRVRQ